ncbi:MAG: serpin family protein [Kiritimatiellia bacterium]|jgi:serpin B
MRILPLAIVSASLVAARGLAASPEAVAAMNTRGFELLRLAVEDAGGSGNVLLSPYSINSAFGLVWLGAKGETEAEIRSVLGLPEEAGAFLGEIGQSIQSSAQAKALTSNSAWVGLGQALLPEYRNAIRATFGAGVFPTDFGDPAKAASDINRFVSRTTGEMIPSLLAADAISPGTKLLLVNTLYFRAKWRVEFPRENTRKAPFTRGDGSAGDVDLMHAAFDRAGYFEDADAAIRGIALPYEDPRFRFIAILPDAEGGSIARTLERLSEGALDPWLDQGDAAVKVWLPKLDIEFSAAIEPLLEKLGMATPFSARADFSGIGGTRDLYIDSVIHATRLRADEEKTEAAAATAILVRATSLPPPPPEYKLFRADRPFVVVLRDDRTGVVLFCGVVEKP